MSDSTAWSVDAVVLAAGKGTRMKSELAKVLHPLAGEPLLAHVLAAVRSAGIGHIVVVVGHQADRVRGLDAGDDLVFALQEPQNGTGHAVQVAAEHLRPDGFTVVLNGDVPLLRPETVRGLVTATVSAGASATVLTCVVPDAGAYGRIVKDEAGRLQAIVEARDASEAELAIGEFNTGVYCFRTELLREVLGRLTNDNDQGEYYLTDTIGHLVAAGHEVQAWPTDDPGEVMGINTVDELAAAEELFRRRRR